MKKFNLWNVGFAVNGEKFFGTNVEDDFAKKFALASENSFFTVNHGLANDVFRVAKREIFFIARSTLNSVNETLEQNLHILTKNVRLIEEILKVFSDFSQGLLLKENDPVDSFDALRARLPDTNIH